MSEFTSDTSRAERVRRKFRKQWGGEYYRTNLTGNAEIDKEFIKINDIYLKYEESFDEKRVNEYEKDGWKRYRKSASVSEFVPEEFRAYIEYFYAGEMNWASFKSLCESEPTFAELALIGCLNSSESIRKVKEEYLNK